jgi:hypothetical protein
MLVCRVTVQLPDRPGSLGRITTLLGRLGVDIRQVVIMERDGEAAVDEFVVEVPGVVIYRTLAQLLEEVPGVVVLGIVPLTDEPARPAKGATAALN